MLITGLLLARLLTEKPAIDDVMHMMAEVPAVEGDVDSRPGGFDRRRDAREIASAISHVASDFFEAQVMVVYAAYESGNKRDAIGDHGLSFGTWQLRGLPAELAFDPKYAAQVWLKRARRANQDCILNEPAERLAPLASGNCDHAKKKTRWRVELAEHL
jgi:hypothetical protein